MLLIETTRAAVDTEEGSQSVFFSDFLERSVAASFQASSKGWMGCEKRARRFPDAAALTATAGPENPVLTTRAPRLPSPPGAWVVVQNDRRPLSPGLIRHFVKDVDGGIDQDIFDINEALGLDLFEGDIRLDGVQDRNSIIGENYRWPQTIPYVLEDSLEMNAKGVILNAFERYRLKTCIDFKPWTGETNYISVFKGSGCWSSIGNKRVGKQSLSIGENCDKIATIQHEFLHALGFWHEQSRSDRDDYVSIMWDRIQSGKENNFNTYDDKVSDALNVPYDYTSVMHYSKTAFRNGTKPTIVTRIPDFMDVIGQRMDFSDSDLLKLNRLYNCSSSLSFMDSCNFELENVCGMIQGSGDSADWQRLSRVPGGPESDHSNMGQCAGAGFFMHFNSSAVGAGATAMLESRTLYPKRGFQCLQFFLYNSGGAGDQLNIYIREYSAGAPNGTVVLVEEIKDDDGKSYFWDRPSKVGEVAFFPNGTQFRRGPPFGTSTFITHERLKSRDFIKGDDVYILLTVEDISHLNTTSPQPVPTADIPITGTTTARTTTARIPDLCVKFTCENDGICTVRDGKAECRCPSGEDWWYMGERCEKRGSTRDTIVIAVSSTAAVFGVMLVVTLVSVYCTRMRYRQKTGSNIADVTVENVS
ncbi:Meprin A subunit beta [Myotis brandtii]|uniref:Metalloendopeptidase n=1 Tax=Myotis brandtii TaxID=109478 RepID=S7NWH1_MYOBR|nr:Meprin A subunit beta [Myotis brandtii]